jgi:hypothetical protein
MTDSWSCADFPDTGCCTSCHEDVEYGYDLTGGKYGEVCCYVKREMDKRGLSLDEPKP